MKADRRVGTLIENAEHALAWVNALRTEWGLEPIEHLKQGVPNNSSGCALAESLAYDGGPIAHFINSGTVTFGWNSRQMPIEVATFEHDFERRFYPDLIKPGSTETDWYPDAPPRPSAEGSPAQMA